MDPVSLRPVAGAVVRWGSRSARSGVGGAYSLAIPVGIRRIIVSGDGAKQVEKIIFLRQPNEAAVLDVLLPEPAENEAQTPALVLDRGLPISSEGKDLPADLPGAGTLTVADALGNRDRPLPLGPSGTKAHEPVWLETGRAILWGLDALTRDRKDQRQLGVYRYDLAPAQSRLVAGGAGIRFLGMSPAGDQLVAGNYKNVYVAAARRSPPETLRCVFSLEQKPGAVLSVAWGGDGRIYFTVEDQIPVDAGRSFGRSRIASIRPDGTDYQSGWQATPDASFRYPFFGSGGQAFFGRFSLDGRDQALWGRFGPASAARKILNEAWRVAGFDPNRNHLYYIYRNNLHLRVNDSGADYIIAQSVVQADCRP